MRDQLHTAWATLKLQGWVTFARPTFKFAIIFQPMIYATMIYMMYQDRSQGELNSYLLAGVVLMVMWNAVIMSSAGDIERERFRGTLENLVIAPGGFLSILLGKIVGNTLLGLSSVVTILLFSHFALQVQFQVAHPLIFCLVYLLMTVTFCSIGLILAVSFAVSRNARGYLNALSFPIYILCGLVFPIEILPGWTRPFSYILAPTWGFKSLKLAIEGISNFGQLYWYLFILVLLLLIYTAVSLLFYRLLEKKTRKDGTLGVY